MARNYNNWFHRHEHFDDERLDYMSESETEEEEQVPLKPRSGSADVTYGSLLSRPLRRAFSYKSHTVSLYLFCEKSICGS